MDSENKTFKVQLKFEISGIPFCLIFCIKILKLNHCIVGIIATTAKMASMFIYAFAPNTIVFCIGRYMCFFALNIGHIFFRLLLLILGQMVEVINAMTMIALRTMLSKTVAASEQGLYI